MAVRFILGRSGAGKTHYCVEQVRSRLRAAAEGVPLILLVPEQATFQIERTLIEGGGGNEGISGFCRARVLSFQRFARHLFNELGGPADPPIEPLAKQMVLRAILGRMRDSLPTFGRSLDRPGFIARLAEIFREFHQYRVDSARLRERAAGEPRARLKGRLIELADAFDAFNEYLRTAHLADPDAALTLAADRLAASGLARGAKVWIDGFAGFTPQELAFLGELAAVAESVELALVCDPTDLPATTPLGSVSPSPGRLFRRTELTYLRLNRLFAERGVRVEPSIRLDTIHRFAPDSPLARLEREMFTRARPSGIAAPTSQSKDLLARRDDALLLIEAEDRRREARAAVNHIRHLVARFGLRYRDIAVILRSLDEHAPYLVEAFEDAGVPYFLDRREPIGHHPLVELLRSAVGAVVRRLHPHDVIAFLKTDLMAGSDLASFRDAVDRLENYALQYGLAGPAWLSPDGWTFHQSTAIGQEDLAGQPVEDISQLVKVARTGLAPLAEFYQQVAAAGGTMPVRQWTAALWTLLATLKVESTLDRWADQAAHEPPAWAAVHAQALAAVTKLLTDLTTALGDQPMPATEFAAVLEAALSQVTLGLVPPALDQVLVGAIERSRHPHIRAALVLGMSERSFPRLGAVQPILTDEDRQALVDRPAVSAVERPRSVGGKEDDSADPPIIELAPARSELLFDEDLLAYLALTRAAERLWVSWPIADDGGKPINPSRYVRRLVEMFPSFPVVRLADQNAALSAVTVSQLAGHLAGRLTSGAPAALDATLYEAARKTDRPAVARAMQSLGYRNRPTLAAGLAARLFAPHGAVSGSVTRLESFAACPFQHLARFGLALQPRERIELGAMQLGRLYHELLREMYERLAGPHRQPVDWSARPPEQLRAMVSQLVESARDKLAVPALSQGAAGYLLAQAERVLGDLAEAFAAAAAASPTVRQVAAELVFGLGDDAHLPPLKLPLANRGRLVLRGKIDRVDLAAGGQLFVIDYKTGQRAVDWPGLFHGLSLQLPAYLLAIAQHADRLPSTLAADHSRSPADRIWPAGAFFQQIIPTLPNEDPPASDAAPPSERDRLVGFRRMGFFVDSAGRLLDAELAAGEASPFVKLKLKKDSTPAASGCDAISDVQLAGLIELTSEWLCRLGGEILAGQIAVSPYQLKHRSPCGMCDYRSVCRLDFAYNRPRQLASINRKQILGKLAAEGGEHEANVE